MVKRILDSPARSLGLMLVVLVCCALPDLLRPTQLTAANFRRVEGGLTRADVRGILGGPPGDYRTGPTPPTPLTGAPVNLPSWLKIEQWQGDEGVFWVVFDPSGRAAQKHYFPGSPPEDRPLANYLWRLGRLFGVG